MGVVNHVGTPKHGLKAKQVQADLLCCLKQLIMENPFAALYRWVAAHQDDIKNWEDLSLNEHLNVIVDGLGKKGAHFQCGELDGVKVTGSPRTAFEQYWEAKVARKLYRGKHMTNKYEFNLVW